MMEKETLLKRLADASRASDGKQIELVYIEDRTALSRFAENVIHQNIEQADHRILARVSLGDRVGLAVGNAVEPEAITGTVQKATEIAENQNSDPDFPGFIASPVAPPAPSAYSSATAGFSADQRATAIKTAVEACSKAGLMASGLFKIETKTVAVVNSPGTAQYFAETAAEFSLTASDDTAAAAGWATGYQRDVDKLNATQVIDTAVQKAVASRNPRPYPPGEYTVILEPAAVGQLLLFLGFLGFGGGSFASGRSFMARQMGQLITGENITIIEDPFAPEMAGMPFDYEGVPKKRVVLIENGIAKGVVFDRLNAKKAGMESTGHALPPDNSFGPYPRNMAISAGTIPFKEVIATTREGVLITHFWYLNYLNPRRVQMTGTTLDGTFLIKDGKIAHPIINMRATPALLEMFGRVEAIADERIVYPQFNSVMLVPGMKITVFALGEDTDEG